MYFPSDMNFQYFFFDTYLGYFLQALPVALIAGGIYLVYHVKRTYRPITGKLIWKALFVCYITGLICLVIGHDVLNVFWYTLIYHMDSGHSIPMFVWTYNIIPDFYKHINGEAIGNILMFLLFGILYPASHHGSTFVKTFITGFIYVAVIELVQPVFGRAFDINDIILNTLGILVSSATYFSVANIVRRKRNKPL